MTKTIKTRNSFVALCEIASQNNWCWNINCTTCGHGAFKVSFSKIIKGQHPDKDLFWPYGKENHSPLKETDDCRDFFRNTSIGNQMDLASMVAGAKLSDIQAVAKFPDWLGYIGLVVTHCPNHDAQKIISDSFLPQFVDLVKNKKLSEYLKEKQTKDKYLSIADLDMIERSMLL